MTWTTLAASQGWYAKVWGEYHRWLMSPRMELGERIEQSSPFIKLLAKL